MPFQSGDVRKNRVSAFLYKNENIIYSFDFLKMPKNKSLINFENDKNRHKTVKME